MRSFHGRTILGCIIAVSCYFFSATMAVASPPEIAWVASHNGPGSELDGVADATVRDGFLYVVGFVTTLDHSTRGYVTIKYAPDGTEVWSRVYEGFVGHANNSDVASSVAVDAAGNVARGPRDRFALFGGFRFRRALFFAFELLLGAVAFRRRRRRGGLHQPHEAEVMIRMLQIILAQHPVARGRRITRQLQVAFIDVRGRTTDLGVRPIAFHGPVGVSAAAALMIVMMSAAWFTTAAPLTLH